MDKDEFKFAVSVGARTLALLAGGPEDEDREDIVVIYQRMEWQWMNSVLVAPLKDRRQRSRTVRRSGQARAVCSERYFAL